MIKISEQRKLFKTFANQFEQFNKNFNTCKVFYKQNLINAMQVTWDSDSCQSCTLHIEPSIPHMLK